jgi:hypothetical protein
MLPKKVMYDFYFSAAQKKRREKAGKPPLFRDGVEYTEMVKKGRPLRGIDTDFKKVLTALDYS